MKISLFMASMIVIISSQSVFARGGGRPSFSEMDGNSDGRVSLEEFMKKPQEHFNRIDANQDGFIQSEEMAAMGETRRERRR